MSEPVPTPARPKRKIILSALAFAAIALAGILIVLYAWNLPPFRSTLQATENALVRGQVTIIEISDGPMNNVPPNASRLWLRYICSTRV